jgi:hypothetical protein
MRCPSPRTIASACCSAGSSRSRRKPPSKPAHRSASQRAGHRTHGAAGGTPERSGSLTPQLGSQLQLRARRKPDIADRLRTRFAWGLLTGIEPPELEVRIAILCKKAEVEAVALPDDVAMYIASSIKSNVRELKAR